MITREKIDEITQKIIVGFHPERVILFGSYAAGNPTPDSDLDILVVKEISLPRHRRANEIRKALIGAMVPMDIMVYTPEEFESEKVAEVFFF
jgi:predicted nucleotidyltransferase